MIITRTPLRISLAGGGTDLQSYYLKEEGQVINMAIDKYLYVVVKKQLGVVEYKYRINWSTVEFCNEINNIKHPIVREALKFFKIDFPIEITTFSDVPANTGLGSSSTFAVGLVYALCSLLGKNTSKYFIASTAAKIEINLVKRIIGKQDHFASSYGGLNVFTFKKDDTVKVEPIICNKKTYKYLENNLLLFYIGDKRNSTSILKKQNSRSNKNISILTKMKHQVFEIKKIIESDNKIYNIGSILNNGWDLKKKLTNSISSKKIDNIYYKAMKNGSLGGKILGAGGGGFILLFVPKRKQKIIKNLLKNYYFMPFSIDVSGTRITYFDNRL